MGKVLGGYLGEERPLVARAHRVEGAGAVGDDAGEDVDASGGALGVRGGAEGVGKVQALHQLRHIDAIGLQNRALGQVDLVELQILHPLHDRGGARQEAGAHAPGPRAEPQIKAGGLDLSLGEGGRMGDEPSLSHGCDLAGGENAAALQPGSGGFQVC